MQYIKKNIKSLILQSVILYLGLIPVILILGWIYGSGGSNSFNSLLQILYSAIIINLGLTFIFFSIFKDDRFVIRFLMTIVITFVALGGTFGLLNLKHEIEMKNRINQYDNPEYFEKVEDSLDFYIE